MNVAELLELEAIRGVPIRLYLGPPMFVLSPGTRVYRARQVLDFRGYLDKFEPVGHRVVEVMPTAEWSAVPIVHGEQ